MEIKKGQIVNFRSNPQPTLEGSAVNISPVRAKSFKVTTGSGNYSQYVATVKAYAQAGMSFEHIANAGETLGDMVERGELDSSLIEGRQEKAGEIAEEESKVLAWQNRGEVISVTHQIASPTPVTGQEVVQTTQSLTQEQTPPQNLNVLEGIAVFNQKVSEQLENNPYLRAPADLKKAA